MEKKIITHSVDETLNLSRQLGENARAGDIYALSGELGTGKTVIAQGIARGMGITEDVTSPSYTLLEVYPATPPLYHFDLYRLEKEDELDNLFFEEYWEAEGVSVIEWAERAGDRLPKRRTNISLKYLNEQEREITIEYPDD